MKILLNQPYSFCQLGSRDNQEDSRYPDADVPHGFDPFFMVCDGVGGCDKGEVASKTVCEAFAHSLAHMEWDSVFTTADFKIALSSAYTALGKKTKDENRGMATTLTFAAFHQGGCTVAHMGDSRIYHIRPKVGILYRSDDHSLVNALVHSGNLSPEEAINHPDSNIITRYISVPEPGVERPDATVMLLKDISAGDYFFLCSDGVLHRLSDEALVDVLSSNLSDKDMIDTIARLCASSEDNNTAILIPIKEVLSKEQDLDELDGPGKEIEGSETFPFSQEQEQARDISSDVPTKLKTKIYNIFKHLFFS